MDNNNYVNTNVNEDSSTKLEFRTLSEDEKTKLALVKNDEVNIFKDRLSDEDETKVKDLIEKLENKNIGEFSDGYHTFNELYHHRAILFSIICNANKQLAWKSKLHDDGTMYDGMFIVGINTPDGPATYHYDIDPYWDLFDVISLERAPKWDGHTPEEAIKRIESLNEDDKDLDSISKLFRSLDRRGYHYDKLTYGILGTLMMTFSYDRVLHRRIQHIRRIMGSHGKDVIYR